MRTAGIICEYNPFHAGHRLQIAGTRAALGPDTAVVCLMSGSYVQRGEPAAWPKYLRAEAAVRHGADLVLELPVTAAVNAAGFFAAGGVECLEKLHCIDTLSFGAECGDTAALQELAQVLDSEAFEEKLREAIATGCSYAAARSQALGQLGQDGELLRAPNNALAADYIRALNRLGSPICPLAIPRDLSLPSATELRCANVTNGANGVKDAKETAAFMQYVPDATLYKEETRHSLAYGERAMLAILRTLPDEAFEQMPFGGEGLWSLVMKECRRQPDIKGILTACKSKRYAMSRLKRMLLLLMLGISEADLQREIPYLRVLAFNDRGRQILHQAGKTSELPLVSGKIPEDPASQAYFRLESRAADLYDLFAASEQRENAGMLRGEHPVYLPETPERPEGPERPERPKRQKS